MKITAPRIVVGVDDSEESTAALAWAVRQAGAIGASIEAVYAFQRPIPIPYSPAIRVPAAEFAAEAKAALDKVIDTCLAGHPGVKATTTVVEGRPADVLTEAARDAELLVLGSSGSSGIVALLAGSTDYAVVHHAPCPLVLVPHPAHPEGARNDVALQQDAGATSSQHCQSPDHTVVPRSVAGDRELPSPLERRLHRRLLLPSRPMRQGKRLRPMAPALRRMSRQRRTTPPSTASIRRLRE
jgi:nucleotide-binding universal stress UspA family protein